MDKKLLFNKLIKEKTISVYDDCIKCNKEGKLLNGLCFDCWENEQGVKNV